MNNDFMRAFNPCLLQRCSCASCTFAKLPRQGDISCGDFWGVYKYHPDYDELGTSFVLINTKQGEASFNRIKKRFKVVEREAIEHPLEINKTIVSPFGLHPGRKHFYSALNLKPFHKLVEDSLNHHYDIGIVGVWYGINFGSVLTYFALYTFLRNIGYDAVFLPRPNDLWADRAAEFDSQNSLAMKFICNHCNILKNNKSQEEFFFFNRNCDTFIVGSDVVWNYQVCGRTAGHSFFLDFVLSDKKKISYAASFGSAFVATEEYKEFAKKLLLRFDAISIREDSGVEIAKKLTKRRDIKQVLDPCFLLKAEEFLSVCGDNRSNIRNRDYIFSYIINTEQVKLKHKLLLIAKKCINGIDIRLCPNPHEPIKTSIIEYFNQYSICDPDVEEWIQLISNAKFFVGDSYHGLCFSLIFHVPFIIIFNKDNKTIARFNSLLSIVDLNDRLLVGTTSDVDIERIIKTPIDWRKVDALLDSKRNYSRKWLEDKLLQERPYCDPDLSVLEHRLNVVVKMIKDSSLNKDEVKAVRKISKIRLALLNIKNIFKK